MAGSFPTCCGAPRPATLPPRRRQPQDPAASAPTRGVCHLCHLTHPVTHPDSGDTEAGEGGRAIAPATSPRVVDQLGGRAAKAVSAEGPWTGPRFEGFRQFHEPVLGGAKGRPGPGAGDRRYGRRYGPEIGVVVFFENLPGVGVSDLIYCASLLARSVQDRRRGLVERLPAGLRLKQPHCKIQLISGAVIQHQHVLIAALSEQSLKAFTVVRNWQLGRDNIELLKDQQ